MKPEKLFVQRHTASRDLRARFKPKKKKEKKKLYLEQILTIMLCQLVIYT